MRYIQSVSESRKIIFALQIFFLVGLMMFPRGNLAPYSEYLEHPASPLVFKSKETNNPVFQIVKTHCLTRLTYDSIRDSNVTGYVFEPVNMVTRVVDSQLLFAFDPDWQDESPFIKQKDGFSLSVNIGPSKRIFFHLS